MMSTIVYIDTSVDRLDSIVFHKLATYDIFIGEVVNPTC